MKKLNSTLLIIAFSLSFVCNAAENSVIGSDTLTIATYNIRVITPVDIGFRAWKNRRNDVAQVIKLNKFDVFGVQEIKNKQQKRDLISRLPDYTLFSKGRDNTKGSKGENIGIFYNKARFQMIDNGFFFLSETPSIAGKGWDAALNRICVWVKLYDNVSKNSFYFFNVHFDHLGKIAREKSVILVNEKIKSIAKDSPVICGGDFNTAITETTLFDVFSPQLKDSRQLAERIQNGQQATYNGWDTESSTFPDTYRIDYIFCKNIQIILYNVLTTKTENNIYPSDHFPVIIKCRII